MAIGTTAAIIGGSLASAGIGAMASNKAAKAQAGAARQDMEFQKETRDIIRGDYGPYRGAGENALAAYMYELGLGPKPTIGGNQLTVEEIQNVRGGNRPLSGLNLPGGFPLPGRESGAFPTPVAYGSGTSGGWMGGNVSGGLPTPVNPGVIFPGAGNAQPGGGGMFRVGDQTFATREEAQAYADANSTPGMEYGGFTKTPGYDFRLGQGNDNINALAGASGGLVSGRTLQALTEYGQDYASGEYGNYLSRLGGLIDTGMGAAGMSGQASQNAAAGVSNALAGIGNAQSAGYMGMSNALTGGINNLVGYQMYGQGIGVNPYNPNTGGGKWWQGVQ